jgi:hypothetical protein
LALYAFVKMKNRIITVNRFTIYRNSDTVDAALAKLNADVAVLIAANP